MGFPQLTRGISTACALLCPAVAFGITIVDRPLDSTGYGYTSHGGQQQIFDHFEITTGTPVDQVTWYGLFSDGLRANSRSSASFDVYLFRSDPEGEIISPEGAITMGTPTNAVLAVKGELSSGAGIGEGDPLHGGDIKQWSVDLPWVYLDPGKYWISICANSTEPGFFLWNHSSGIDGGLDYYGSISPSNEPNVLSAESVPERETMAFAIHFVPDASSGFALMLMGMGALVAMQRK